ncbi:MAG: efflux transporter outer membrane subunit [Myxococcales bacterium]|nr:efflux transporter outer membrane subunit [Myxococcales bacterium]
MSVHDVVGCGLVRTGAGVLGTSPSRVFWFVPLIIVFAGCGVIHRVAQEPSPPVNVPLKFLHASQTSSTSVEGYRVDWWKAIEEPELHDLVSNALEGSMDVQAAYARLAAAEAGARASWSGYLPSGNISADYSRSTQRLAFRPEGQNELNNAQFRIQGEASYEVDLWGRVHNQARAGVAELQATELDIDAAQVTVSADVVETWLQAIEQRAIVTLLEAQLETNETYLNLVELRFRQGQSNALAVYQQRQQAKSVQAQIPPVKAQLATLEHRLSVLIGQPPGEVKVSRAELPAVPLMPELGIPSALLQQRPDVRAAQRRVVAADHRVGSAVADRFPTIQLSASAGYLVFKPTSVGDIVSSSLFDNFIGNLAAGLTAPIFDQVRLEAEVRRARAQLDELLAAYGRTVLTALREVEDALVQSAYQADRVKELKEQVGLAQVTLDEAQRRYQNGLSDYLSVLTSLQSLQSAEQNLITARRLQLSYWVQLHRALGGTRAEVPEEAS